MQQEQIEFQVNRQQFINALNALKKIADNAIYDPEDSYDCLSVILETCSDYTRNIFFKHVLDTKENK